MSVNGVTGASDVYSTYAAQPKDTEAKTAASSESNKTGTSAKDTGVVYEPSKVADKTPKKTYKTDANLVAKMKADAENRTAQLQSIVEKMLTKQGQTYGAANDMWSILSSGKFTVDPATKLQAQADIAEDGYWGVSKTSQRILDFATALTGGDPDKIEDMRSAFKKGFAQAEKQWGGKLPDISQKTYDAVMKGFDDMAEKAQKAQNIEE